MGVRTALPRMALSMYNIYCSIADHQRTMGIPAGGRRADTPVGGGQAGIPPAGAINVLQYSADGHTYVPALWRKEDTEGGGSPNVEAGKMPVPVG